MFHGQSIYDIALLIIFVLISLTIHEFMHAFTAFKLGDRTAFEQGRISFNPLQHIDPIMTVVLPIVTIILFGTPILAAKPVPFDPRYVKYDEFGAAMIAAAGPLSNLALAFVGALGLHLTGANTALELFTVLNVSLFVFNILPIPPLDGSRVLYAFAPEPVQEVMRTIEPYGLMIIFALVLLGGLNGVITHLDQIVLNFLP